MRSLRIVGVALLVAIALGACATTTSSRSIPAWVTATPPPSSGYTYFVGSGSDPDGNIAAANENATHSLLSDVTRYLGVQINSQTTVETRADLKNFETRIAETIKESSAATVGDFSVVDRWIRRDGRQVTVFILGKYQTAALEAEKSRLASLERERTDAVAVPEQQGNLLLAQGKAYEAAVRFMQAALAATQPGVQNGSIKFARNMKKAGDAISNLTVSVVTDNLTATLGQAFSGPFVVRLTVATDGAERGLANAPFLVSYPRLRANGRPGTETRNLVSDAEGKVTVRLPPPQLIGRQTVTVALDMAPQLDPLLHASRAGGALVSSLEEQVNSVRAVLHYVASSRATSIRTGVLVTDLDRGGTPIPEDDTAAGIVKALSQAGFEIYPIHSTRESGTLSEPELLKMLRNDYGSTVKRAVVGQARIADFEHSGGNYIVKVTGRVEVADLATGTILFATSQIKLSRASDATSAISAAFKDLGVSIGNEIRNRLYE